ncbi:nuclear transport factor 2 family protein [Kitasatospora brasiliensis]|uniref:nuclear transport factor 2 family protein n=1 Tax=Kitasatospora brasiliensis TaxID=3058040 RepID=UPI00292F3722|nr:nuclear transport factor 2 family protein [Kitasatospora sp. K002]
MNQDQNQNLDELVSAGLRRLEAGDLAGFRALCTPGATVWQNDGLGTQSIEDRLKRIGEFFTDAESVRFEVVRRFHKPDEVFQQNVLHRVARDGSLSRVHGSTHFRFEGELIAAIEEYLYEVPESPLS